MILSHKTSHNHVIVFTVKTPPTPRAAAVSAVSALPQATSVHPGDSKVADRQALGKL